MARPPYSPSPAEGAGTGATPNGLPALWRDLSNLNGFDSPAIKHEWIPSPKLTVPPAETLADKIAQFKPYLGVTPTGKLVIDQFDHYPLHRLPPYSLNAATIPLALRAF